MRPLELIVITFLVVTLFVTSSSAGLFFFYFFLLKGNMETRNCGTNEVYDSCVNPNCYGTCGNLYYFCGFLYTGTYGEIVGISTKASLIMDFGRRNDVSMNHPAPEFAVKVAAGVNKVMFVKVKEAHVYIGLSAEVIAKAHEQINLCSPANFSCLLTSRKLHITTQK
ncbi:hypothetical protein NECAME_15348, partial [Necator americanus]